MKEVARDLADGSTKILAHPRKTEWHKPKVYVPSVQWRPATDVTRYEWARRSTPPHQRPFFEDLQRRVRETPPSLMTKDLVKKLKAAQVTMSNGMSGFDPKVFDSLKGELDSCEIHTTDPTGEWRFQISAEIWRGVLCDRIGVSCRDYRTLPDWELLVRLRSWVLPDNREAFIWLPDMDPELSGWQARYENARFNNLQMISPRGVEPADQRPCPKEDSDAV